jgi:aryl-alcohol dehydrogenase-like predicted oxidoreductase
LNAADFRAYAPRFSGDNLHKNLQIVETLQNIANSQGATVAQVAIAWVLSRGEDIVPLIGARRRDQLAESLKAVDLSLSAEELSQIEAAVPLNAVAGERYPTQIMASLDSENI